MTLEDALMYESYYGLAEAPFSLTSNPKYLFRSESLSKGLESLQHAIERGDGGMVVTGDAGTGKTMLCRALLDRSDRKTFVSLVHDPPRSADDLLAAILEDVGVVSRGAGSAARERRARTSDLVTAIEHFQRSLVPLGTRTVVILDDAHNLPLAVLEQVQNLSTLGSHGETPLQIVLVGQGDLVSRLQAPELHALDRGISLRYQLTPLMEEEVGAYVTHRLATANGAGSVTFTPDALQFVYTYTSGNPRLVNMLCDRALLGGSLAETACIDDGIVATAAEALELEPVSQPKRSWLGRLLGRKL